VVVNASEAVPPAFRSAQGTIGLRMPADDTALALIRAVGPLATTSANMSGSADTGHATDLDPRLLEAARVWLEGGGNCASGIASTVVDCTGDVPQVVRAGAVGTA
jgi:L-threonylcarbamoyladenylate synthase